MRVVLADIDKAFERVETPKRSSPLHAADELRAPALKHADFRHVSLKTRLGAGQREDRVGLEGLQLTLAFPVDLPDPVGVGRVPKVGEQNQLHSPQDGVERWHHARHLVHAPPQKTPWRTASGDAGIGSVGPHQTTSNFLQCRLLRRPVKSDRRWTRRTWWSQSSRAAPAFSSPMRWRHPQRHRISAGTATGSLPAGRGGE